MVFFCKEMRKVSRYRSKFMVHTIHSARLDIIIVPDFKEKLARAI